MRNLTTLLEKGNLTPKERILLLVHNQVAKDTTGKEILTEADKHAICEAWRPQNGETAVYNRYNDGWITESGMKLDAQTTYLNAQNTLLRVSRLVDYAMWTDCKNEGGYFRKIELGVDHDEALDFIIENSGLIFDKTVYQLAFQNVSESVRQDILKLYPDAETESQYLDQEEKLAELFNGKSWLTSEAKGKLTDLIIDVIHNKYAKILSKKRFKHDEWWFNDYFAELPIIEIAQKCAEDNNINYEASDEDLDEAAKTQKSARTVNHLIGGDTSLDKEFRRKELSKGLLAQKIYEYAEARKTDVGELLRETILKWLNEGLFVKEYEPIWNNDSTNTCNDADTKLPHKEILKRWLKAKAEAKDILQKLIDTGELHVENRDQDFYGTKEKTKILTGKSLYHCENDLAFVKDYKKQAENLSSLGSLILFLRNQDFLEDYASLLAVADMYKKVSKVYEIDMGYKIDGFINGFKLSIAQLNHELHYVADKLEESIHREHDIKFSAEVFLDDMLVHLENVEPVMGEMETRYFEEFKKFLGDEFQ